MTVQNNSRYRVALSFSLSGFFSYIIIILNYNLFNLISLPGTFGARENVILQASVSIIATLLIIFKYRSINYTFSKTIGWFFLLNIIEILYTIITYTEEAPSEIIKVFSTYLIILSYFVISNYCNKKYDHFIDSLINISTIVMLIYIFQSLLYNTRGIKIFQIYQFSYGNQRIDIRNNGIRLIAPDLVETSTILSIGFLFQKRTKQKKYYILNILVCLVYEIYTTHTRSTLIIILITFCSCALFCMKGNRLIKILLFFLGIITLFLLMEEVNSYIAKAVFSITSRSDYSLYHRVDSYKFYIEGLFEHPIFGFGLLPDNSASYYRLLHGYGHYSINDVGLVGHIAHFGIIGIITYGYIVVLFYRRIRRSGSINPIVLAAFISIVLSMINLSMFDAERLLSLVVLFVVLENEERKNNIEEK